MFSIMKLPALTSHLGLQFRRTNYPITIRRDHRSNSKRNKCVICPPNYPLPIRAKEIISVSRYEN